MTKKQSKRKNRRWSREVTEHSNALDLESGVFKGSATSIARSLKRSAEHSKRRKTSPFRSALSMLTFYENRAGSKLSASRRRVLDRAKDELRRLYGKPAARKRASQNEVTGPRSHDRGLRLNR